MITLKPPFRAENMQGLYKKVLRGHYPKISKQYSADIQAIVKMLLQVSPKKRPTSVEILTNSIVKKKIKELFPDDDISLETETDTFKNSLLKTIYFPKNTQDILYLTDKLPKPSYDNGLEKAVEKHKLSYRKRATSESPGAGGTKDTSSNQGSYKYIKNKNKEPSPKRSHVSDTNEGAELPSVKIKHSPQVKHKKKLSNSIEKLPEVRSKSNSPKDMTSIERIASRIEQESKKKPIMNIDKEYNNLQKILDRKQQDYEHKSNKVC